MQPSLLRTTSSASLMDFEDATLSAAQVALAPTPMGFDVPVVVATPEVIDALLFVGVQLTTPDPNLQAIDPRLTHVDPYLSSATPAFINSASFPISFLKHGPHEKSAAGPTPDEILGVSLSFEEPDSTIDTEQTDATENPDAVCGMEALRATSLPYVVYPAQVEYEPTINGLSAADIVSQAQEYDPLHNDGTSFIYPMKANLDSRYLPLPANKEFLEQFHGPGRSVYSDGIESMSTAIPSGGAVGSSGALKLDNEKAAIFDSEREYGCAVKGNIDDRAVKTYLTGKSTNSLVLVIPRDAALVAKGQRDQEHIAWLKERMKHIITEFQLTSMAEEEELTGFVDLEQLLDGSLWEGAEPYYSPLQLKKQVTVEIRNVGTAIGQMMGITKNLKKRTFKSKRFSTAAGRAELELLALWRKKVRMNVAKKRSEEHRQCPVAQIEKAMWRNMVL